MSTSVRRLLVVARADGEAFKALFEGCYARWEIAGSVRRQRAEVGDVEHVVIPKFEARPHLDPTMNLLWRRMEELTNAPGLLSDDSLPLTKHLYPGGNYRWGMKYRGVDFRGFNHEVFTADGQNWGSVLAIRTGPAEYSKMLVTRLAARGIGCAQVEGYVKYVNGNIRSVPEERDYFEVCGVPYQEPTERI